jgi:hypothetical protein
MEKINLCQITLWRSTFWAFDEKTDAKTMVRLLWDLFDRISVLEKENKELTIKVENLSFFDKNTGKETK